MKETSQRVYVASSDDAGKIFFDNSPGNIGFNASGLPERAQGRGA